MTTYWRTVSLERRQYMTIDVEIGEHDSDDDIAYAAEWMGGWDDDDGVQITSNVETSKEPDFALVGNRLVRWEAPAIAPPDGVFVSALEGKWATNGHIAVRRDVAGSVRATGWRVASGLDALLTSVEVDAPMERVKVVDGDEPITASFGIWCNYTHVADLGDVWSVAGRSDMFAVVANGEVVAVIMGRRLQ